MQISLKWINELVNIEKINLDLLIEKLTLGGFEVEEILEVEINKQKQTVLDISATANRSDSLSIYGISTEIAALLNQSVKIPKYILKSDNWNQIIDNKANSCANDSNCSIFISIIVENLINQASPNWMKEKLISSGIVPYNNLVDFQNYILLETGYPFQFYDINKIESKLNTSEFSLSIEKAKDNQKFLASNEVCYKLNNSILTVNANEIPISIAGIIEEKTFSVSKSTNSVLIEGSIFKAGKIRQQSRKLGLRTDRSARYEKSIRTTYLKESMWRLLLLLRIANPNLVFKLHTINQIEEKPLESILLRYETVNEILGPINSLNKNTFTYLNPKTIEEYLTRLNFKFIYDKSQLAWNVEIPHLRMEDISREIDLIEEIGRLHGFNNFLTTLPKIYTIGEEDSTYKIRKKITACLLNLGLNEFIHYSLVNQTTVLTNEVQLINPLLSDCSSLRISLLPNLIKTVQENLKQKTFSIEGFEYGHVFSFDSEMKFKEREKLAGIFGGNKTKLSWTDSETPISWFEAKGKIEQFCNQLNLVTNWKQYSEVKTSKLFHPYRTAEIYLESGRYLGIFGQIHPLLSNKLGISSELYLFEFDIENIENQLQINKLPFYKSYSLYPKIIKDLSFIIEKEIPFERIRKILYCNGTEFLTEINLLDEYQGKSIPAQHTSLCLQMVFQSNTRTLENKEIETIIQKFQSILIQKFNAIIRN